MVIRERSRKACPSPLSIRHTPSLADALITSAGDRIVVPPPVAQQLEQLRRQHGVRSLRPLPCSTRSSIRSGIDVADLERDDLGDAQSRHIYDHPFLGLFQPFF